MWTSATPGLLIILCNQSNWSSHICNKIINTIIKKNFNKDKPKNRCFISVIGYGYEVKELCSGFLDDLYNNPILVENKTQKVSDGNGGLVDVSVNQPIWVEPIKTDGFVSTQGMWEIIDQLQDRLPYEIEKDYPPVILDIGCALKNNFIIKKKHRCLLFGIYKDTPIDYRCMIIFHKDGLIAYTIRMIAQEMERLANL